MTEVLFVLTVIYVAYVLYVIINDNKAIAKSITPTAEPEKQVSPEQASVEAVLKKKHQKHSKPQYQKPLNQLTLKNQ